MMFLRFQRGKSPIKKKPCVLCSGNPSRCYSLPQGLVSVFPALQHGAIVARDVTEPAGVPEESSSSEAGLCALPAGLRSPHLPSAAAPAPPKLSPNRGCWLLLVLSSQQGILSTLSHRGYVLNETGNDSSSVLHSWLVLSRRKACQGQFWFLDGAMPAPSLMNLEIHACDLLCLIEILSVIVVWWCPLEIECIFFS